MKQLFCLGLMLFASLSLPARDRVYGPQGRLSVKVTLPKGFDPRTDHCPMVILMHGIFSSKDFIPMPSIAKGLVREGIASVRFDFDGHGRSQGRMQDMTVEKEIADALAIWKYVRALPYVTDIGLLGHSQGGVIASMVAGRLAAGKDGRPTGVCALLGGDETWQRVPAHHPDA
ncbi:MAG: alpha/beta fold hydrolase [Bacteroidales bacterium]|nr:alpha/beta fold hydrolase [Bacteroidales bacterium]